MVNKKYTAIFSTLREETVFKYLGTTYKILEFTSKATGITDNKNPSYIYYIELYIYLTASGRYLLIENPSGDLLETMKEVSENE